MKNHIQHHSTLKFIVSLIFVFVLNFDSIAQNGKWKEIHPGVWKIVIGKPEDFNLLSAAGVLPSAELANFSREKFPLDVSQISIEVKNQKTYIRFTLEEKEQLFGFGLNFQSVYQRGKIIRLHVDHYSDTDNGRTHAPVPFYVSSLGCGVFVNVAKYFDVYAGSAVRKHSKHLPVVKDKGFPLDYIGLEPGWRSKSYPCTFEWDKTRFPNPSGFVKQIEANHIKINFWTNPYVSLGSSICTKMKALSASYLVWNGIVLDLSMPAASKLIFDKFEKEHIQIGVSGHKIDEVDVFDSYVWPGVATFPYWYNAFVKYHFHGIPPFHGMNLEDGFLSETQRHQVNESL